MSVWVLLVEDPWKNQTVLVYENFQGAMAGAMRVHSDMCFDTYGKYTVGSLQDWTWTYFEGDSFLSSADISTGGEIVFEILKAAVIE